jgi:hypothetical protein
MQIESRIDLSLNVFCVMVASGDKKRPYFFNIPTDVTQRGAQVFECCVAEAISRHEAWVSGNATNFAAASAPTTAAENTEPAASPAASRKKTSAPVQEKVEDVTPPATEARKKKGAPAPKTALIVFEKNDFCKKVFSEIVTERLGTGWAKDPECASDAKAIAANLEALKITCAIDGEVTQEFKDRVLAELNALYE